MPEPIQILIKKGQVAEGSTPAAPNIEQGKPNMQQAAVNTALIAAGKQMMLQGVKQYGNITGDYALVNSISTAMSIGADVLMIAKGGWVGLIAVAGKHALEFANLSISNMQSNRTVDLYKERSGYIATRGSRYGDG